MQYPSAFITLFAATAVLALPLNINMGAYSPALVVGDGAIGFEGATGANQVSNLMATLQGAAASGAAANGAAAAVPQATGTAAAITQSQTSDILPQGMGKSVNTRDLTAEEQEELQEEIDIEDNTKRALTADEQEELDEEIEEEDNAKRGLSLSASNLVKKEADEDIAKRDLAGFNAALAFSTGALKNGPEVQLGTGEGGSGVGIIQKAGGTTSATPAAGTNGARSAR